MYAMYGMDNGIYGPNLFAFKFSHCCCYILYISDGRNGTKVK